jgi:hypothetical protein
MTNAAEVSDNRYKLEIAYDADPTSPREWDNLGTMVCWHGRYSLVDDHRYSDMNDFLKNLIADSKIYGGDLVSYVKSGNADGLRLEYDKSSRDWGLTYYDDYFKKWYDVGSYGAPLDLAYSTVADDILENMGDEDLLNLAEKAYLIQPLFL